MLYLSCQAPLPSFQALQIQRIFNAVLLKNCRVVKSSSTLAIALASACAVAAWCMHNLDEEGVEHLKAIGAQSADGSLPT
jgi:hypothetical protein